MPSVFLSPSTQEYNLYYDGVNSEEYYMNLIADYMEPYLTASGIGFGRNNPGKRVGAAIALSNAGSYGLHLALHSNAAAPANSGNARGVDVYYYSGSERGRRAADIVARNIKPIYPLPDDVRSLANSTFAELRLTRAPAVLAELGYHDNAEDAEWIRGNLQSIARALALSVAEFFGVPFVEPEGDTGLRGLVITGGGRLNIRERPSLDSGVLTQVANGSTLALLANEGDWWRVRVGNTVGYASAQYIRQQ